MRRIFLLLLLSLASNAYANQCPINEASKCFTIIGRTEIKNGWSPNLLVIDVNNKTYGIGTNEFNGYPSSLPAPPVKGKFKLCPLNKQAKVSYQGESIELYCIATYEQNS